jgi:hypothetical protein
MAAKYQNRPERSLTSPVFQGAQDIGETMLRPMFANLIGEENTATIAPGSFGFSFKARAARTRCNFPEDALEAESYPRERRRLNAARRTG